MSSRSFRDAVAERFKSQPNTWVSAYQLMQLGGAMAWRTRVSECRTQLGMQIDCNVERDSNGVAVSYYKYVPALAKGQADLFERAS